jgi:ATP-binding cassette subfamily B (MDR/TAP) protein 7
VRRLAVHIWPKKDWATRGRVVLGVGLLVSGKVRHLGRLERVSSGSVTAAERAYCIPLFFREVIDTLNMPLDAQSAVWVVCGPVILACTPRLLPSAREAELACER